MLALIAIACCIVIPIAVAGLAVLLGKISGSKIEHPGMAPLGAADRDGSRRRGGQP